MTVTLGTYGPYTATLTHDALGRIQSLRTAGVAQSWAYDGDGNFRTDTTSGVTTTYGYGSVPNEVQTVSTPGQPVRY